MSASSSNGVKPGLFGYLKGLFRNGSESDANNNDSAETSLISDSVPLVPPPVEVALSAAPVAAAAPAPAVAAPPANDNVDKLGGGVTPGVPVALQPIIDGLSTELRKRVRVAAVGDLTVSIAIDKVLAQLAQGQVRIPFGDIRRGAPEVFAPGADFDRISVAIPLNEILSRINPALLVRRTAQRQVEVPDEISSPFAGRGNGLSLSVGNAKPVPPAAPRTAAPVAPPASGRGASSAAAAARLPAPFPFTPPRPAPAVARDLPAASIPFKAAPAQPVRPTAPPSVVPVRAIPQPAPAPAQPAARVTSHAVISIALSSLMETWPESLRLEILQTNQGEARVAMPVELIEASLKRGRVVYSWKTVRSWISPAAPTSVSVHDAAEVELPLRVIAPLFLARKQAASNQSRATMDETIPNLFFGFPQPDAAAPAAPVSPVASVAPAASLAEVPDPIPFLPARQAATTAAAASSAAASAAVAAAAASAAAAAASVTKPADTNYYLWDDASETRLFHIAALKQKGSSGTEFVKRYASPNEIVSRAASLEGVAGVLIALPDGLMVASRLSGELNGDTLAAFLPQIFAKVSACTKELRMGELNNVSFTVGNVPWKIFRVNAIFFAAFGRPAQPMPTAELAGLAAELDRKNN